jgi:hypothetical protein
VGLVTAPTLVEYLNLRRPFYVYAIAKDLGLVGTSFTSPTVWAVGMLRDPSVAYLTPDGTIEKRRPYWTLLYNTPQDAVSLFPHC